VPFKFVAPSDVAVTTGTSVTVLSGSPVFPEFTYGSDALLIFSVVGLL